MKNAKPKLKKRVSRTADETKKGVASLLRKLRPLLPKEVKKLNTLYGGGVIYEIGKKGEVLVELNYYCTLKKDGEKVCLPDSITVKVSITKLSEHLDCSWPKAGDVYRTRTIRRREDGTFRLEAVAVAVTKALEGIEAWKQRLVDNKKREEVRKTKEKIDLIRLRKVLPKKYRSCLRSCSSGSTSFYVSYDDDDETIYEISTTVKSLDLVKKLALLLEE